MPTPTAHSEEISYHESTLIKGGIHLLLNFGLERFTELAKVAWDDRIEKCLVKCGDYFNYTSRVGRP